MSSDSLITMVIGSIFAVAGIIALVLVAAGVIK